MKRTNLDRSKLRLNAETVRLLSAENLEQVNGGKCTAGMTSTWVDGNCTNACVTVWDSCPSQLCNV
jgi:hypothetical protein